MGDKLLIGATKREWTTAESIYHPPFRLGGVGSQFNPRRVIAGTVGSSWSIVAWQLLVAQSHQDKKIRRLDTAPPVCNVLLP